MLKIQNLLQPLLDAVDRGAPNLLKLLQVGRILPARVLAQPQPGLLRLQIANSEVLARSQVQLPPGTALRLEVVKGPPLPELRVVRPPTPAQVQQAVARSAMVRQLPAQEARQAVTDLKAEVRTPRQAEFVQRLAAALDGAGIRLDRLRPADVQRAVAHSGIFHEALLATRAMPAGNDLKTQLLQLAALLRAELRLPAPTADGPVAKPDPAQRPALANENPAGATPQREAGNDSLLQKLVRLVEGSASRIQLQQSVALPAEDTSRQAWQMELPVHLRDATHDLTLRIERDAANAGADGQPGWAVNLAFDFDSIGSLQCRVALSGERVATTFWCEQPLTHQRLESRLPMLRNALVAQGLEVVHLAGVLGEPSEPLMPIPLPESLLDERA